MEKKHTGYHFEDYEAQKKAGKDPQFVAAKAGIKDELDYWK